MNATYKVTIRLADQIARALTTLAGMSEMGASGLVPPSVAFCSKVFARLVGPSQSRITVSQMMHWAEKAEKQSA